MSSFLVFALEAQLASFGDLAGYERRGTGAWPAKSALVGMLGASLGVRRDDKEALDNLRGLSFAVAVYDEGEIIRDFHTAQAVHQKIKRPATRAIALSEGKKQSAISTVLSMRDYRCGVSYGVSVWGDTMCLPSLAAALNRPVFVPYLGRKSCPLSAPVNAKVVVVDNPVLSFDHVVLPPWRLDNKTTSISYIASDPHFALETAIVETRFDVPIDKERWHFNEREVQIIRGAG